MKGRPKGKTDIMKYDRRRTRECHRDQVIQLGFRTMVFDSVEIFVHVPTLSAYIHTARITRRITLYNASNA